MSFLSIIAFLMLSSREELYGIFGEENYLAIHLLVEIFMVLFSLAIAFQIWLSSRHNSDSTLLRLGALFLSVGLLELIHATAYKGMPFFLQQSSTYTATWLYMAARLTLVIGLIYIFYFKSQPITKQRRILSYLISLLYTAVILGTVYYPEPLLEPLVTDEGITTLKQNLQWLALILQIVFLVIILKKYKMSSRRSVLLIVSSITLMVSDVLFSVYSSVYDIVNFTGHLFQLVSFTLLFQVIFYASVEKPFRALRQVNSSLQHSQEEVKRFAYNDANTGLPNERFFTEYMKNEVEEGSSSKAVVVLGIERYNTIKQSLGSKYADHLLVLITKRLKLYLPKAYRLCKLPEDRFAIFIQQYDETKDIYQLTKSLQELMEKPFEIEHFSITSQVYVGISLYPKDATTVEDLIQYAQFATYEAKKTEDYVAFYTAKMQDSRTINLTLEQDLKKAIIYDELFLEYQPQMEMETGEIRSVEALIRWRHPKRGIISPLDFIPLAEKSGLIVPIGQWVLETACEHTVKWQKQHKKSLKVAVNLSMGQLYQKNFVQVVVQTLNKTGLPAQDLQLEITESMTMNTKQIIPVLEELKNLGIKIAVDDFGTGYSSLSYLKDFPLDCLKIDRSFINNILVNTNDEALVKMILSMAKHLKLKVVAEGIETLDQLKYLKDCQCDLIQGYYISKPVAFDKLLHEFESIQSNASEQFMLV